MTILGSILAQKIVTPQHMAFFLPSQAELQCSSHVGC